MADFPKTIKIGAKSYHVKLEDALSDERECGHCVFEHLLIRVNKALPDTERDETLLHEILHACCNFVGIAENASLTEEEFVTRVSPILFTVLRENDHSFNLHE